MKKKAKISIEQLRHFEPISALSDERLEEFITLAYIDDLSLGVSLFREGDIDNQTVYLLEGDVQLTSSDGNIERVVSHKADEAKFPLDDSQPRQATASAIGAVKVIRIDNSVLDYMMMWDQMAVSESAIAPDLPEENPAQKKQEPQIQAVENPEQKTDGVDRSWIRKVRHIMAFESMPPANIKQLLERMESLDVNEGEQIVQQGEPGDYYYVLTEGEAQVTRTVELADLKPGRSFGEEALISGGKRNATVTMKSNGVVMRLAKKDFDALLKEPLLNRISPDDARLSIAKGDKWLDVRHAKEYNHSRLPHAINIPLHELRLRLNELDKDTNYICYCSTGKRSSAAAFLLAQQGFKAQVLNGGVQVMPQDLVK